MPLSTEVFVMVIFIVGLPFFYAILKNSGMRGGGFFMISYLLMTLSNTFTVLEEFWLNGLFNFCEHAFITAGAVMMLSGVLKLTAGKTHPRVLPGSNVAGD